MGLGLASDQQSPRPLEPHEKDARSNVLVNHSSTRGVTNNRYSLITGVKPEEIGWFVFNDLHR